MVRQLFRRLALGLFCVYLAVFPGSTITVMLDRVPAWGGWMGGALLLLQGALAFCWLIGNHGRRGALVALVVFLLAWLVEHAGVTTGAPFGRYRYTAALQLQLLGVVPLAIPCAWLAVSLGAWQLAQRQRSAPAPLVAATLILLLDLQIETVATAINRYWIWLDGGRYYGVPLSNFAAWWAVGGLMALAVGRGLGTHEGALYDSKRSCPDGGERRTANDERPMTYNARRPTLDDGSPSEPSSFVLRPSSFVTELRNFLADRLASYMPPPAFVVSGALPGCLYVLSALMFTAINLARGYGVAGLVGLALLAAIALSAWIARRAPAAAPAAHRTAD